MKRMELPKATKKEFAKRTKLVELLQKDDSDQLNMEYLDLMNSYRWFPEIYEENGNVGIKSILGKILVPPLFDDVIYSPTQIEYQPVVAAKKSSKWGLITTDGTASEITDFVYDRIAPLSFPLAVVQKNEKWGYLRFNGEHFTGIEFDSIEIWENGTTFCNGFSVFEKNGFHGITDGQRITEPVYDQINYLNMGDWITVVKNGKNGYINKDGQFTENEEDDMWIAFDIG